MTAETIIVYDGNLRCHMVHQSSQQEIQTDAPVAKGGQGKAISPMDLFTSSLGACVATVLGIAAHRSNLDITGMRIEATHAAPPAPSKTMAPINIKITLPRRETPFSPAELELLVQASQKCPVKQFLHPDLDVITEFV